MQATQIDSPLDLESYFPKIGEITYLNQETNFLTSLVPSYLASVVRMPLKSTKKKIPFIEIFLNLLIPFSCQSKEIY